jgi:hypothetical protein
VAVRWTSCEPSFSSPDKVVITTRVANKRLSKNHAAFLMKDSSLYFDKSYTSQAAEYYNVAVTPFSTTTFNNINSKSYEKNEHYSKKSKISYFLFKSGFIIVFMTQDLLGSFGKMTKRRLGIFPKLPNKSLLINWDNKS